MTEMSEKVRNKKIYKIIVLVAISLLTLSLYFLFFFSNLKIEVFNKANYDIDSLNIGNKFFSIKKGESLFIDNCKSISMQSGLPFGFPEAKIKGKSKDTFPLFLCGTGIEEIRKGLHHFDITMSENNGFYRLYWQRHK